MYTHGDAASQSVGQELCEGHEYDATQCAAVSCGGMTKADDDDYTNDYDDGGEAAAIPRLYAVPAVANKLVNVASKDAVPSTTWGLMSPIFGVASLLCLCCMGARFGQTFVQKRRRPGFTMVPSDDMLLSAYEGNADPREVMSRPYERVPML